MSELRWVLVFLGALVIGLIWALGTGRLRPYTAKFSRVRDRARLEPTVDGEASELPRESDGDAEPEERATEAPIDRVITVRFIPKENPLPADETVLALRAVGLRHGQYGIFHMYTDDTGRESQFSVANLIEPGSFDLSNLSATTIPGMNFFLVLPGPGDPVERFDKMVDTARELARTLDADLRDEKGSSWSIQRERYVREEVIAYRHQLDEARE